MDISDLTLKLIIILIPGALASRIIQKITVHKTWSDFQFVVNSILLGVASYVFLQIVYSFILSVEKSYCDNTLSFERKSLKVWQGIQEKGAISYFEVLYSSVVAIIVALFISWIDYNKYLNKLTQRFGISNKYGDEDLYSYFLNANEIKEVYIRHMKHKITYHGYIDSFADADSIKEITLRDVTVYSYPESEEMYSLNFIYLSLPKDDVIIEYLKIEQDDERSRETETSQDNN